MLLVAVVVVVAVMVDVDDAVVDEGDGRDAEDVVGGGRGVRRPWMIVGVVVPVVEHFVGVVVAVRYGPEEIVDARR